VKKNLEQDLTLRSGILVARNDPIAKRRMIWYDMDDPHTYYDSEAMQTN
jgi:hypothetical protein